MIAREQLSLTLLYHVLLLGAQSQQTPTSLKSRLGTVKRIYSTITSPFCTISQPMMKISVITDISEIYWIY